MNTPDTMHHSAHHKQLTLCFTSRTAFLSEGGLSPLSKRNTTIMQNSIEHKYRSILVEDISWKDCPQTQHQTQHLLRQLRQHMTKELTTSQANRLMHKVKMWQCLLAPLHPTRNASCSLSLRCAAKVRILVVMMMQMATMTMMVSVSLAKASVADRNMAHQWAGCFGLPCFLERAVDCFCFFMLSYLLGGAKTLSRFCPMLQTSSRKNPESGSLRK